MDFQNKDIENIYSALCKLVHADRLKEALIQLKILMTGLNDSDLSDQYEDIDQNYHLLLEYYFKGVADPQRDSVHAKLKTLLLELADKARQQALAQTGILAYQLKLRLEKEKELEKEEATRRIDDFSFDLEFIKLLNENDLSAEASEALNEAAVTPKIFQILWLSDKYSDSDLQLIRAIRKSKNLPWHEKCVAVSAITLSLINCFDKGKFSVLCDFYDERQLQVWQRALAGLIIASFIYDKRIALYPTIASRLAGYSADEFFARDFNSFLIQVLKAFETENLTKKFKEEIWPDVQKFESKLREKLDIDNIINRELIEDKNPDWEQVFEDSPGLLDKISKMSEMQMDGLDLFMNTFAMLKSFDFFWEISNWFRPFYKENKAAKEAISDKVQGKWDFLESLESSFYICNSDKYSFCFNIKHIPDEQSLGVIRLFNMEAEGMKELMADENLLNKPGKDNHIFTQYIQDLYRFFKLYPFHKDFRDIFSIQWDIVGNWLVDKMGKKEDILKNSADFLFSKIHYTEAAKLYSHLSEKAGPNQEVLEKLAYCYQKMGNYPLALEYYRRAEMFDTNRLWSLKKIIFCYRKLGNLEAALQWALEAAKLEPEDSYIQTMLGNCYLDLQQFDHALPHYFKAEFLAPENKKVLRPIAWCCFVLGKLDLARNYLQQVIGESGNANDLINAGHVELCCGNKPKAMEFYISAIATETLSLVKFAEILDFDKQHLVANGVKPTEIQLIADYLRFR